MNEKRNLLSMAYRSAVGCGPAAGRIVTGVEQNDMTEANEQQAASARELVIKVEDELQKFRHGILALMDKNRIPSAITVESKMSHYAEDGHVAYADATKITEKSIDEVVPWSRRCRKILEVPQLQLIDKVVDVPIVMQRRFPTIQRVQKTVEVPQIQYVDKIVEAPVAAAQQPAPVDAETFLRVEDVSVGTQTVSRKRKLSMETESAESTDGMSDTEHGLSRPGVKWTRLVKGTRQGKISICSRWRLTWRQVAHTSRP